MNDRAVVTASEGGGLSSAAVHTPEYGAFEKGENNEALCPIRGCGGVLYLTFTECVPLYAVDPPWPGGKGGYAASDAVSSAWAVECVEGHKVWMHTDQITADNAAGLTEDDLTGDTAPPFRMEALNQAFRPEGER